MSGDIVINYHNRIITTELLTLGNLFIIKKIFTFHLYRIEGLKFPVFCSGSHLDFYK